VLALWRRCGGGGPERKKFGPPSVAVLQFAFWILNFAFLFMKGGSDAKKESGLQLSSPHGR
jgi:hypothetical protein